MVHLLARVVGVGVEAADMLVQEVFSRNLRDRKAVARYAGLTGPRTRAARNDASADLPKQAMRACAAG
jgi:transposase